MAESRLEKFTNKKLMKVFPYSLLFTDMLA